MSRYSAYFVAHLVVNRVWSRQARGLCRSSYRQWAIIHHKISVLSSSWSCTSISITGSLKIISATYVVREIYQNVLKTLLKTRSCKMILPTGYIRKGTSVLLLLSSLSLALAWLPTPITAYAVRSAVDDGHKRRTSSCGATGIHNVLVGIVFVSQYTVLYIETNQVILLYSWLLWRSLNVGW